MEVLEVKRWRISNWIKKIEDLETIQLKVKKIEIFIMDKMFL
jgi:hypothetical protein